MPFEVQTYRDLQHVGCEHTEGLYAGWDISADYIQVADIDCAEFGEHNFTPIGSAEGFSGSYDGQGFEIKNLYIKSTESSQNCGLFMGLVQGGTVCNLKITNAKIVLESEGTTGTFTAGILAGKISSADLVISETVVENVHVEGTVRDTIAQKNSVHLGLLVGEVFYVEDDAISYNENPINITNCSAVGMVYSTGTSTIWPSMGGLVGDSLGASYENCQVFCDITSIPNATVGGLAGKSAGPSGFENTQTYTNCFFEGNIRGEELYLAGGIFGFLESGNVYNCFSKGSITVTPTEADYADFGGLIGYLVDLETVIENCGSLTNVSVTESTEETGAGGFIGYAFSETLSITNCYASGTVSNITHSGRFIGVLYDETTTITNCFVNTTVDGPFDFVGGEGTYSGITGKTTAEMKQVATFSSVWDIANWDVYDNEVWFIEEGFMYPQPAFLFNPASYDLHGSGTEQDPFLVNSYAALCRVGTGFEGWGLSNHYEQTDDIDCMELGYKDNFDPVGSSSFPFYGSYDGNNHVIDNLNIVRIGKNLGLFSNANGAEIRNIKLKNTKLVSNTGFGYGGAICGQLDNSVVENCSVECSMVDAAESGGAFGRVRSGSVVDSVYVKVNHKIKTSWYGGYGGFAYWVDGRGGYGDIHISNCSVDIIIETTFSSGLAMYPGGFAYFVGNGNILMENIYAKGEISGRISNAVGFCSISLNELNNLNIKNCYGIVDLFFDTDPVGHPFIRYQKKLNDTITFENCFSAGKGNPNWSGCIDIFGTDEMNLTVSNCYWDTERSGMVQSSEGTPKTTEEMKTLATFTPEFDMVNWDAFDPEDPTIWYIEAGHDYPMLGWEYHPDSYDMDGTGTEQDPFLVKTYRTLLRVGTGFNGWDLEGYYEQVADIDCMELGYKHNFPMIGKTTVWNDIDNAFTGSFDGGNFIINNFRIDNLVINNEVIFQVAMFGNCYAGTIKNIRIKNAFIQNTQPLESGIRRTAILVAQSNASGKDTLIKNCHIEGRINALGTATGITQTTYAPAGVQIKIIDCTAKVDINSHYAYGVLGYTARAKLNNIAITGKLNGFNGAAGVFGWMTDYSISEIRECSFVGTISDVGGTTGNAWYAGFGDQISFLENGREIHDCYVNAVIAVKRLEAVVGGMFRENASSSSLKLNVCTNCYVVADIRVHGDTITAGTVDAFCGNHWNTPNEGMLNGIYIDTDVTDHFSTTHGVTSKTTIEMTSPFSGDAFDGWDFNEVWREWNGDYPRFRWEPIKVSYVSVQGTSGKIDLALYHLQVSGANQLRVKASNEVLGLRLTKEQSSPVKIQTSDGTFFIEEW